MDISDKYKRDKIVSGGKLEKTKEYFADPNIQDTVFGRSETDDENLLKIRKIVSRKAPIALKLANRIIDEGYDKPVVEGIKLELENLEEIFCTKDAYEGLTSLGRKRPEFKGE